MSKSVFLAGSALFVAGLGYSLLSSNKDRSVDLAEIDEDDCITEAEVVEIFDALFLQTQDILAKIMQQIQALQMAGQSIPEAQLKGLLKIEMERALLERQKKLLDQFGFDYDCLEEATWEFLEDEDKYPKVKKAVDRLQKLWESTTGEPVAGWRPGKATQNAITAEDLLPPDILIQVAEKYFSALTECMREIVDRYKAEGKSLQDPMVQQLLNREFAEKANDAGEEAIGNEGISMSVFEGSIKEHSNNPNVGRALGMLQMRQQQELMALGQG